MPVSFKVKDNRTSISRKLKQLEDELDNFLTFFLQEMATDLVLFSPADTGTYMLSHRVSTGPVSGFESSYGKQRFGEAAFNMFKERAETQLFSDIAALPDKANMDNVVFTNIALHANDVEYLHGHATYTTVRNRANNHAKRAAARAEST